MALESMAFAMMGHTKVESRRGNVVWIDISLPLQWSTAGLFTMRLAESSLVMKQTTCHSCFVVIYNLVKRR